jgi:hypothetical protein
MVPKIPENYTVPKSCCVTVQVYRLTVKLRALPANWYCIEEQAAFGNKPNIHIDGCANTTMCKQITLCKID